MTPQTKAAITALCDKTNPRHAEGWCWWEKATAMAELIERVEPDLVVEVGIFGGSSMLPQALQLRDNGHGIIIGLDPWTKAAATEGQLPPEHVKWWSEVNLERVMQRFMAQLVALDLVEVAVPIRASSQTVVHLFQAGSIDILHIDGTHSELASMRDVLGYFPKVRHGGFIWLDDIHWPTNKKAVEWLDGHCEIGNTLVSPFGQARLYRKP
jgi:predicted O-methyltransferase YrrM